MYLRKTLKEFAEDCEFRRECSKSLHIDMCGSCANRVQCKQVMRIVKEAQDPAELVRLLNEIGIEVNRNERETTSNA